MEQLNFPYEKLIKKAVGETTGVKKMKKFVLVLAVLIMTMSFVGCDNGSTGTTPGSGSGGGTLTITNFPSKYNGKFVQFVSAQPDGGELWGVQSVSMSENTLPQINNGSASLAMWKIEFSGQASPYSGNNTITNGQLWIFETQTTHGDREVIYLESFSFTDGNALIALDLEDDDDLDRLPYITIT